MRRFILLCMMLLAGLTVSAAFADDKDIGAKADGKPAPKPAYRIVHTFPHDMGAFTQGLLFHGGALYESTGQYSRSRIRRVDIYTGRALQEWAFPDQLFGEGLTLIGKYLYGISWRTGVGFVLDRERLEPIGYFRYEGEGWGLTDDGRSLYMTDGTDRIFVRDPANFKTVKIIEVKDEKGRPVFKLNELEWINGEIWANIWKDNRIARIDPKTGRVKSWLDLSGLVKKTKNADNIDNVLNGIAHDPKTGHVFVTGKYWPSLYALEVEGLKPAPRLATHVGVPKAAN